MTNLKNVFFLCGINKYLVSRFRKHFNSTKICSILTLVIYSVVMPTVNRVLIKEVSEIFKAKSFHSFLICFSYDNCWTVANGSLNLDLLDNVYLVEKGNLKLVLTWTTWTFPFYLSLLSLSLFPLFLLPYHLPLLVGIRVMLVRFHLRVY